MGALQASYRVITASVVTVLGVTAALATFLGAAIAVSLIQTGVGWLITSAVVYLVLAVAVPAAFACLGQRRRRGRLETARRAILASLALNLALAPYGLTTLVM